MGEKYFFDIPVYRLTQEQYYKDLGAYIEKNMYSGSPSHNKLKKKIYEKEPERKQNMEQHLRETYGGAWDYNEIIGWIQLRFLGRQIRGEYLRVKAKRIVRTRKKVFEWDTWKLAPEIDIPEEANNTEIFHLINEYLSDCKKELKGRHLDTNRLDLIGSYVDWRSLLNKAENV